MLNFDSFSTKFCVRFHHWFFLWENEFLSWRYVLTKTAQMTKISTSPIWNKILKIWDTLFELIEIEVQCSKNCFNFFLLQAGASKKKTELQRPHPRLEEKNQIFTENIYSACNSMQMVVFWKNLLFL